MDMPVDLIWDVVAKTALVLAALYAVLWLIRRNYVRGGAARQGVSLMVLQSAQLGPGRSLHLIGVGGKTLLVGSTSQQISLIAEVDPMQPLEFAEQVPVESFDRYLRKAVEMASSIPVRLRQRPLGRRGGDASVDGEAE